MNFLSSYFLVLKEKILTLFLIDNGINDIVISSKENNYNSEFTTSMYVEQTNILKAKYLAFKLAYIACSDLSAAKESKILATNVPINNIIGVNNQFSNGDELRLHTIFPYDNDAYNVIQSDHCITQVNVNNAYLKTINLDYRNKGLGHE